MKTKLLLLLLLANFSIYAQTNLVPNSSFENWNGYDLKDWTVENTISTSTDFTGGQYSVRLWYTSVSPKIITQVPMKAGVTYTVKYQYKYLSNNYGGDHPIALNISKAGSATTLSSSTFATNNLWTEKVTTFTPDQDLSYDLSISAFSFDNAPFSFLIDDIEVYVQGTEQFTLIPDVEFEKKLIELGLDSGETDGKIPTSKIKTVKSLTFNDGLVADLTGIQDFEALELFTYNGGSFSQTNGGNGKLKVIDLSKNTKLTSLNIYGTQLASLDISKNINLTSINLSGNKLSNLDTSFNLSLKYLNLSYNPLTTLDVTKNLALNSLDCSFTTLSTFNLSNNTALEGLYIRNVELKTLDISNYLNLVTLDCSNNQLTAIDLTKNTKLINLSCGSNLLTSLDLSKNINLITLRASKNKLRSLNLKNGKNTLINSAIFDLRENPELSCIIVDDASYSLANWGNYKDNSAYYSNYDCTTVTAIPDIAFEDKLIALGIDTDGKNGIVLNSSITTITSLDVSNSTITNLTGIEGFTSLITLNISGNSIQKLNLSKNTALTTLNSSNNPALKCIQVADEAAAAKWTVTKDATTSLNIDCNEYTKIPDVNFEKKLISYGIDSGAPDGKVLTSNVSNVKLLSVSSSAITDLTGIEDFVSLTVLYASNNKLTTVDVSKNINLTTLDFDANSLENLNISKNTKLTQLYCSSNKIISLDLSNLTELDLLSCSSNQLTSLDLSNNTKLYSLNAGANRFKELDLSKNPVLRTVRCEDNRFMTKLNLQNGKNTVISTLNLKNTPSIYCVLVDDVTYANTQWASYKDTDLNFSLTCSTPEYILIPDPEFEKALISNVIDGEIDGKVLKSKVDSKESLRFNGGLITDLTGLEYFKNLKSLDCSGTAYSTPSKLTKLDVSALTNLTSLSCNYLNLTSLNISKNAALKDISARGNLLTKFDFSSNTALETISIENNKITDLNIMSNANLIGLYCSNNPITELDVSKNKALAYLDATDLLITSIDLSQNTALNSLDLERDRIKVLDISKNLKLEYLNCSQNGLTSLDISKNTLIKSLSCYNNSLEYLNLKNGNNKNFITAGNGQGFNSNINLTCIEVDDVDYSNANWSGLKDLTATYSNSCPAVLIYTAIPDSNFEQKLIDLKIDTDGKNGKVLISSIYNVTDLDVSNSNIKDLTGIEDFASLGTLNCSNNQLSALPVYKNILLNSLNCSYNEIINLDVSKNVNLKTFSVSFNKIKYLDVSKNTKLKEFDCASNNLYNLNVKNGNNANMQNMIFGNFTENPNLLCIQVDDVAFSTENWIAKDATASYSVDVCTENIAYTLIPDPNFESVLIERGIDKDGLNGKVLTSSIENLKELYATNFTNKISDLTGIEDFLSLENLYCYNGALTKLDVSKNLKLKRLDMENNNVTTLDLSKNTALETLNCSSNGLTQLDISSNVALKSLGAASNTITTIDLSKNIALESANLYGNKLTNIDISANKNLQSISVSNNSDIKSINVSEHSKLVYLYARNCQITSIDVSKNPLLRNLEISGNKIETIDVSKNPAITSLLLDSNQLTSVDLRNGNNNLIVSNNLSFQYNPKLYCILVDDVAYANANWSSKKDAIAAYNTECTGELTLPTNNFAIETKGESCLGENNGEINIVAKTSFAYNATINDKSYTFTNNTLKITALTPGVYQIKITIPGEIFEQNFNVTIQKGATITGKSDVSAKNVNVEITEGTAPFTIFVDGAEQFQTTDTSFTVSLDKAGLVEVTTAKACEGIFAKKVTSYELGTTLAAYPNPTTGIIEIEIPSAKTEVSIDLYNFGGQLVSHGTYNIESGRALLNLEKLPSGIYAAKINLETPEYIKIIKK